uniref:DOMON domain-containing protein n=1 Tax=Globisporangium ultimum (strain ATCC 200006 / CBS 805.95 / DAOM BR144) TaxID=431595 RepID=K3X902_GLOUD
MTIRHELWSGLVAALAMSKFVADGMAAATETNICASKEFLALQPEPFGASPITVKSLVKSGHVCMEFTLAAANPAIGAKWFAVGLSTSGKMVSSPAASVMLFQSSTGSLDKYVLGGYSKKAVEKDADQSGFTVASVSLSTMSFSYQRPLEAATATDVAIDPSKSAKFIWAYGASWPTPGHQRGTKGTVEYTFATESAATYSDTSGNTTTSQPKTPGRSGTSDTTNVYTNPILVDISEPYCEGENCPAVVGGIAFLIMVLCGVLMSAVFRKTRFGRFVLHHRLLAPPVKATTNAVISSPWTMLRQNLADLRVGEVVIMLIFGGAIAALVVLNSGATTQVITGQVVLLILMFLLLPVSRIPLWSVFFGSSFERVIKFHRWTGMAMSCALVVHLVEALKVTSVTEPTQFGQVVPLNGFIAFVSFALMALLANEYIRRKAFEIFYVSHRVLSIVGLVFTILHASRIVGVALAIPLAFYGLGLLFRWYVALTSRHQAMGAGSFTQKLLEAGEKEKNLSVHLCGPFGRLSVNVDEYEVVVIVAGGVGITPMMSLLNQRHLFPPAAAKVKTASDVDHTIQE